MNYRDFRRHCLTSRQSIVSLQSGSAFELPLKYFISNPTDSDRLFYADNICAIPENRNPPKNFQGTVLTIESVNNHSGFTRLMRRDYGKTYFQRPKTLCNDNSPAVEVDREYRLPLMFTIGLQFFGSKWGRIKGIKTDKSYAVYCPYWPPEAQEWLTRKRESGWPDDRLIARIKKGGCHFVSKPHQNNLDDNREWRFSFSKAELILLHSWTPVQKEVYHMLRLVKDEIIDKCGGSDKTALRTYHFKTQMLWACEQKTLEFWNENNVTACVHEILDDMIKTLKYRHCPNYFISENNMLDHLEDNDAFKKEIEILRDCLKRECSDPAATNIAALQSNFCVSFSNALYEILFLFLRSQVFPLNEKLNGPLRDIPYICECFLPELQQLYSAIEADIRLVSIYEVSDRKISKDYNVAYDGYTAALKATTNETMKVLYFNTDSLLDGSGIQWMQKIASWSLYFHRKLSETNPCNRCVLNTYEGDLEVSQCDMQIAESSHDRDSERFSIRKFIIKKIASYFMTQFAKESSKHIPSPMYLMSAAYLTHFHYHTMKDNEKTLSFCDEIYSSYSKIMKLLKNYMSSQTCLPMVIATEFSVLFDDHIRTVLGFILLCKATSTNLSPEDLMKVVFPVSPIRFIRYVGYQCMLNTDDKFPRVFAYTSDDYEHVVPCTRTTVSFSEVFLSAALKCRGVKILRFSSEHNESLTSFGEVLGRIWCCVGKDANFESEDLLLKLNNPTNAADSQIQLELHRIGFVLAEIQASDLVLYFRFQSTDDVKLMERKLRNGAMKTLVENDFKKLLNRGQMPISVSLKWFPGDFERCIKSFSHN